MNNEEPFNLETFCEEISSFFIVKNKILEKNSTFKYITQSTLEDDIICDKSKLRIVLHELINNCLIHSENVGKQQAILLKFSANPLRKNIMKVSISSNNNNFLSKEKIDTYNENTYNELLKKKINFSGLILVKFICEEYLGTDIKISKEDKKVEVSFNVKLLIEKNVSNNSPLKDKAKETPSQFVDTYIDTTENQISIFDLRKDEKDKDQSAIYRFDKNNSINMFFTSKKQNFKEINIIVGESNKQNNDLISNLFIEQFSKSSIVNIFGTTDGSEILNTLYLCLKTETKISAIIFDEEFLFLGSDILVEILTNLKKRSMIPNNTPIFMITVFDGNEEKYIKKGIQIVNKPIEMESFNRVCKQIGLFHS